MTLEAPQIDAIIDALAPGATHREVHPLAGGVSATTLLLTVSTRGGELERYVVRHRPKETSRGRLSPIAEADLMASLNAQGLPVPKPLLKWSADTFIMAWAPGEMRMPPHGSTTSAELLVRIHQQHGPFMESLPPLEDPVPVLERELAAAGLALPVREWMASTSPERCLLHGDFWPANLLWESEQLTAVLDWEHAATGDPLSDVACARVELEVAEGREAAEAFTERYFAMSGRGLAHLSGWDLYVSATALDSMEGWGLPPDVFRHRWKVTQAFRARALEALAQRFNS